MKSLWKPAEARRSKDRLDLLVYRSRLIGSESKLCVWGGGNTSTKTVEKNHLGRTVRVLRIKGSGSDLKASTRRDFPPVALDDLLEGLKRESMTDEEMVDFVARCLLDPKAPRPSIEVLLHAFIDQPDIDHTHADAILSVTNTRSGKKIAHKIFGDELLWIPYVKPGFTLAKRMGEAYQKNPRAKGAILEKHGLITWGPDARTSYERTIEMVSRAELYIKNAFRRSHCRSHFRRSRLSVTYKGRPGKFWSPQVHTTVSSSQKKAWLFENLPVIRKTLSANKKAVLHFVDSPEVMSFVNAKDTARVSRIGPATPDHMLRTKRVPLYVNVGAGFKPAPTVERQIEKYAGSHRRYFERHKASLRACPPRLLAGERSNLSSGIASSSAKEQRTPRNDEGIKMLDPYPKVILVPGIGMITSGSDLKNAKIVAEIYEHSISVMTNASVIDQYESLSEGEAFEMDYWPLELYKLSFAPPEAEFSRSIGLVTGAARGIGRAIAARLAEQGAHVFLSDLDEKGIEEAAHEINQKIKAERALALPMDVTDPEGVRKKFVEITLRLGGLDFLVSNAGIAHVASIEELALQDWEKSFAVNSTGHFLVAREAVRLMRRQAMGGAIVFIASKNVLAPGKDFGAYSAAKAAETQLARVLAIENGEHQIRVNVVNPDGVFKNSGLWDRIKENRAKTYGISAKGLEKYYQNRNLMKTEIVPQDVAESVAFLLSPRASKTTGCILTVDGGLKEAFPR